MATTQKPHEFFSNKVDALKAELPGVTFGYLGNFERWGDDRSFYVFLPHPGRVGTYSDKVSLGAAASEKQLNESIAQWDQIEARVRKLYHNGSVRVEGKK